MWTILKGLLSFLDITGLIARWWTGNQHDKLVVKAAQADVAKETIDDLEKTEAARRVVRDRLIDDPDSVRNPSVNDRPWNPDGLG